MLGATLVTNLLEVAGQVPGSCTYTSACRPLAPPRHSRLPALSLLLFALTVPCLLLRGCAGPSGGAPVNFMSLGSPAGNLVDTPMGNARINPCSKVTICDALQPGSICCIQVNDTAHPGSGSWVSCGTTPTFTTHMAESSMVVGMILTNGADCGYVFASGAKVTASIAFTCDR